MKNLKLSCFIIFILLFNSCGKSEQKNLSKSGNTTSDNSQKDTCDSPDPDINCSFRDMPSELTNIMIISEPYEPGEKLIITGKVYYPDKSTPYPGVIIYAYQTDFTGHYSKKGKETGAAKWHGYLHGWCKTDSNGYYEIHTIRPGRYPSNEFPAHIHPVIKKPDGSQPFYINDFVFKDDSLVNEIYISNLPYGGDSGVLELQKSKDGILLGERYIILTQ